MCIVAIVMYTSIHLLRYSDASIGNGSIFHPMKQTLGASTSLSCWEYSCISLADALLQCHKQAGCMAAWFSPDEDRNLQYGGCVCIEGTQNGSDMAGFVLHMRHFEKRIPGKRSCTETDMLYFIQKVSSLAALEIAYLKTPGIFSDEIVVN